NDSSANYSIEEYARDVVSAIGEACAKDNLAHPVIISESGRALVAHSSVLITEVIDTAVSTVEKALVPPPSDAHAIATGLYDLYTQIQPYNAVESLHDAIELKEMIVESFMHSQMTLPERAYCESLYQHLIAKICTAAATLPEMPEE